MMRKINNEQPSLSTSLVFSKDASYSLSTEQSPRLNNTYKNSKEKSQLCKKFIQNGYCPYQNRCKFAHGLHELKKNQEQNSKYKTKYCGSFIQQGFCSFGNRCNFIHQSKEVSQKIKNADLDIELLEVKWIVVKESRLLKLLQ